MKQKFLIPFVFLYLIAFLKLVSFVYAQKEPMKLGDVDEKMIKMDKYEQYPNAEAVILCHYGNAYYTLNYDGSFNLMFEEKKRIKIFKNSELQQGTVAIYCKKKDKIRNIKAYCYNNENGKIQKIKMDKDAIKEKKINKYYTEIKFTIPNVKEGSVIEYEYEKNIDRIDQIPVWVFENSIPTLWSEFRTLRPNMVVFSERIQTRKPFDINERKDFEINEEIRFKHIRTRFVHKNMPSFQKEPFIASPKDYITNIQHNISGTYSNGSYNSFGISTWEDVMEYLVKSKGFGGYIDEGKNVNRNIVQKLIGGKETHKNKLSAIFEYVKNTITYDYDEDFIATKTVKEVLETKKGGSAEINLFLLAMLLEAKLNAFPVLVSTRNHGKVKIQEPHLNAFNYVLVYVEVNENESYLLDATNPLYILDMVSLEALNGGGLVMKKFDSGETEWLYIQKRKFTRSMSIVAHTLEIDKNGIIKGKITSKFSGYEAATRRQEAIKDLEKKEEDNNEYLDNILDNQNEKKIRDKVNYKNLMDFENPLEVEQNVEIIDKCQINGDFIYLSPLLDNTIQENPFKQNERKYPIDFVYPIENHHSFIFQIPDGYKVDELPKNLKLKSQDGSLRFEFAVQQMADNKLQLVSKFSIGRSLYEPEEYKMLKDFYAQIVAKQQEQVVLKKK